MPRLSKDATSLVLEEKRSDPARSTRCSLALVRFDSSNTYKVKTAWDRDETSFAFVRPVFRRSDPSHNNRKASASVLASYSARPSKVNAPLSSKTRAFIQSSTTSLLLRGSSKS